MPADTGPVGTTSGGSGFWDTLSGLWGDFEGWASEPANQKILLGGGSALVANVLKNKGLLDSDAAKVGYQGKIPDYTVRRTPIQYAYDPNRRPGSAGRRYFSDVEYIPGTGGVASVVQPEIDVNPGVTNPGDTTPQLPDTLLPYYEGEPPRLSVDPMPYDNYAGPREGDVKEEPPRLSDPLPYYEGEPPRLSVDPMPYDNYAGPREGDVKEEPPRLSDPLPYYEGEPPRLSGPLPYYDGPREGDVKEEPPRLPDTPLPYYEGEPPRYPPRLPDTPLPYYEGEPPRLSDAALLKERLTAGGTAIENMFKNKYAEGGIAQLSEGRYLKGETDGMADEVPASIDGQEPAALSDGEFVIPADIVSHLGNGNSEAGAKALKEMMSRIRRERTGNNEQGKQIDPNNFLLA